MGKDLFDKIFLDSKKNKRLIYIETNANDIAFMGYVLSHNSTTVQLHHYTKYGKSDGVIHIQYTDIDYIITDNEYLKSMRYLIDNNTLIDTETNSVLPLSKTSNWIFQILNEYKNDKSVVLGIQINDGWYIGFINDLDDQFLSFSELDRNGILIDTCIYKIADISAIHVNELEARKRLLLYNWRKSQNNI